MKDRGPVFTVSSGRHCPLGATVTIRTQLLHLCLFAQEANTLTDHHDYGFSRLAHFHRIGIPTTRSSRPRPRRWQRLRLTPLPTRLEPFAILGTCDALNILYNLYYHLSLSFVIYILDGYFARYAVVTVETPAAGDIECGITWWKICTGHSIRSDQYRYGLAIAIVARFSFLLRKAFAIATR